MEQLFDLSEEYDAMLNEGLAISGENKMFYIEGRIEDIKANITDLGKVLRILDFGCGIGDSTARLAAHFPKAIQITGTDLSEEALVYARQRHGSDTVNFINLEDLKSRDHFDLCYVNGVFHHIELDQRQGAIALIYTALKKGGHFALCENNPYNPGTQYIMSKIPFDRDAKKISPASCRNLIRSGGFNTILSTRFLFYFPRFLSPFRVLEKYLTGIPLGAQYYVMAVK